MSRIKKSFLCILGIHEKKLVKEIEGYGAVICNREGCNKHWLRHPPSFCRQILDMPCNIVDIEEMKNE